jgi:UDP-3-O-[3-hydroxymyristoyl] glucosamine N-acyltransferase
VKTVKASDVAFFLGAKLLGQDMELQGVCSCDNPKPATLGFLTRPSCRHVQYVGAVFLVPLPFAVDICSGGSWIAVSNPRLSFARAVERFFHERPAANIAKTAVVAPEVYIGEGCTIGEYAIIESGAHIGSGTVIGHHTVVCGCCVIGERCVINTGTVLGLEGLNCPRDENGIPFPLRHSGGLVIGDEVEIGANSTIQRGTIDDTVIGAHVKTSPQVNIGHNCQVGRGTLIASGACLGGKCMVGINVFIGAGCVIKEGVCIGDGATLGMQAAVCRSIAPGVTVMGLDALPLRDLVRFKETTKFRPENGQGRRKDDE